MCYTHRSLKIFNRLICICDIILYTIIVPLKFRYFEIDTYIVKGKGNALSSVPFRCLSMTIQPFTNLVNMLCGQRVEAELAMCTMCILERIPNRELVGTETNTEVIIFTNLVLIQFLTRSRNGFFPAS